MKPIDNAIKIGSKTFIEYLNKRLVKDGLGFIPSPDTELANTDCKTFIRAVIPQSQSDFLAYAHELGHAVGKQVEDSSIQSMFFNTYTSIARLENECLAWDWALRYVRRLGMIFCKEELEFVLKKTLGSYIKQVSQYCSAEANNLINKYSTKWNLHLPRVHVTGLILNVNNSWGAVKNWDTFVFDDVWKEPIEKVLKEPKNWKPWHDIVEHKSKKFNKQKHKY